jgi:RHS repeat-associated protein
VASVTDNAGTTTYHYDSVTGALSGMNTPIGGSISYEYDAFGRVEQVGVKAAPTATESITQYQYDGNNNLTRVIDPTGGETTMSYDAVNRLATRTLPNGVTSTYTYQENTDWVESLTHTNANGDVLAAVTYQRNTDGTPHTITREDGSYVELTYDSSLRLTQETYYSAGGVIVDEIAYTYDADGNRQSVSSGVAEGTYAYDNTTHQLSGITTSSGNESYLYDESGRVWKIIRDDETLTLSYNADDQLETVTDSTGTVVAQYTYDAEGRRIEVDGRDYVVAPMVGTDLDSPHLITNANGDVVSSYVYAGALPLMRLDENGNPVYYLTDAMGSVIGLADRAGASTASFQYDSFGNVRSATGTATDVSAAAGGDFRFQGQWLESSTDLYNFRARYYDPETGRFIGVWQRS